MIRGRATVHVVTHSHARHRPLHNTRILVLSAGICWDKASIYIGDPCDGDIWITTHFTWHANHHRMVIMLILSFAKWCCFGQHQQNKKENASLLSHNHPIRNRSKEKSGIVAEPSHFRTPPSTEAEEKRRQKKTLSNDNVPLRQRKNIILIIKVIKKIVIDELSNGTGISSSSVCGCVCDMKITLNR